MKKYYLEEIKLLSDDHCCGCPELKRWSGIYHCTKRGLSGGAILIDDPVYQGYPIRNKDICQLKELPGKQVGCDCPSFFDDDAPLGISGSMKEDLAREAKENGW